MNRNAPHNTGPATTGKSGLVDAKGLLENLWPEPASRPCLRWLRQQQQKRTIPFLKVGHRVFFNPDKVKQELEKRFTVNAA